MLRDENASRTLRSSAEELQVIPPSKLAIENVSKSFKTATGVVHALDRVSLQVGEGGIRLYRRRERLRKIDAAQHHRRSGKTG